MNRLPIGAFSRLTHLSIKTLRYYHEIGLLEPTDVDRTTGYRYYRTDQAETAQLVRRLRDLEMPVADVKAVLLAPDQVSRDRILSDHLDRLRLQLSQTEAAVESLRSMLGSFAPALITEQQLPGLTTLSVAAEVARVEVGEWWLTNLQRLLSIATEAGIDPAGPAGGVYDDALFTDDRGAARVYLPVHEVPSVGGLDLAYELPAGRFAVATFDGPHRDADRVYAALGTYAAESGRDAAGPVREHYLIGPLEGSDQSQWRTEICWPLD